jgi:hypothetical protein
VVVASATTRVRARLGRDLSRFGKITLLVWALVSAGLYPRPPSEMALVYATSLIAIVGIVAIAASAWLTSARLRPSRATLEDKRLVIERGGKRFDLDVERDVTSAHAFGNASEVATRDGDVWGVVHASPAEAVDFVDALGFGAAGRRATFDVTLSVSVPDRLGSAFVALVTAIFLYFPLAMIGLPATSTALPLVLAAALYELFRFAAQKPVVTVGVDGVAIAHRGRTRFVAADDIAGASQAQPSGHAVIARRDGKPIEVDGGNLFRQAALVARVQALSAREASAAPAPAVLEREGRSVRAWRDHLRAAVAGGYRAAAGPLDQLTSRGATPEQRVGAALALRVADGENGATRVRIAADHCADAHLREALEIAAAQEIDDAKLERALSRLAK